MSLPRVQGSSARQTNRAENGNKSLVRTGANAAKIVVRLRNRGADAYRHDVFGDSIIIERNISAAVRALRCTAPRTQVGHTARLPAHPRCRALRTARGPQLTDARPAPLHGRV